MTDMPHVTVATVVSQNDKFLMVHEVTDTGNAYNQPAGHLELGETIEQAAVRETFEETGWHIKLDYLLGVSHYFAPNNQTNYVRFSYAATALTQDPTAVLDDGIIEAVWLTLAQLKDKKLRSPMVLKDIQRYLNGERYPKSIYQNVNI